MKKRSQSATFLLHSLVRLCTAADDDDTENASLDSAAV